MRWSILVFAAGFAGIAAPLSAQASGPWVGARVRIHLSGATVPLTGTIAEQHSSHLVVFRSGADSATVPLGTIARMEVSRGRHSNVYRGARTGALVGAGVGALLGIGALTEEDSFFDYGPEVVPLSALGGGFMGAMIGTAIGALSSSEQWAPAVVSVRMGGAPTLSFNVAF